MFVNQTMLVTALLLGTASHLHAVPVSIDDGNITFEAPNGFSALTQDEIAKKFPMRNGKIQAVANDSRSVSISYAVTQNAVAPEQLPQLKESLTGYMTKLIPNLQMVKSDFININSQTWVILETITPSADQKVHNIELATSYRGVMFTINFNSDERLFGSYSDQLWASLNSVKIREPSSPLSSLPSSVKAPVSADEEIRRGKAALEKGDLNLATEAFRAALLLQSDNSLAIAGLDQINAMRGEPSTRQDPVSRPASENFDPASKRVSPAPIVSEIEDFNGNSWVTANLAGIASVLLVACLILGATVIFFLKRLSRTTSSGSSRPIIRPPPMR